MVEITITNSLNKDFQKLISHLDNELYDRYGELQNEYNKYNKIEFNENVVIAYNEEIPIGCGCFKEYEEETVEIKRMFVNKNYRGRGISKVILSRLENIAFEKGYKKAILETGIKQLEAVGLYSKQGYKKIENYGQYAGMESSICMLKRL